LNPNIELDTDIIEMVKNGRKIDAIKLIRERRNLGLKESKDLVDSYFKQHPELKVIEAERSNGVILGLIFFALVAAVLYKMGWLFN
jgi:Ribosomal protein L7/L12 C-terminal domain